MFKILHLPRFCIVTVVYRFLLNNNHNKNNGTVRCMSVLCVNNNNCYTSDRNTFNLIRNYANTTNKDERPEVVKNKIINHRS